MIDMNQWEPKHEWHRHGDDFLVVVKHYTVEPVSYNPDMGPHRWNVYAYLYPEHRLFGGFQGSDIWQQATRDLPLHCGASFLRWHYNDDGEVTSVQVGSDYNHLHDDHFSHYATPGDAVEVFIDAEQLFAHLSGKTSQSSTSE